MDILFDLAIVLGVIGGGYFWVKTKVLKPEIIRDIEIFPSRGVPLVKRSHEQQANPTPEVPSAKPAVVEQVEQVESMPPVTEPVRANTGQAAEVPACGATVSEATGLSPMPEDSVLKRHYLAQLAAARQAITHPYPTDSVLRRHFESMSAAKLAPITQVKAAAEIEPAETAAPDAVSLSVPQDSVLKRHYLQWLASKASENPA